MGGVFTSSFLVLPSFLSFLSSSCPSHSHSSFPMIPVQDSQAASLLKISLANSQVIRNFPQAMAKTTRIPNAHEIDSVSANPHGQDRGDDAAVKTHGANARHDQNGHENASVEPRTRTAGTAVMTQPSTLAMVGFVWHHARVSLLFPGFSKMCFPPFLVGLQGDVLMAVTAALSHPLAPIPLQW
ncbi:hypothetical protein F5148DRAFT_717919 [Russula earlei]|uniref:Uncharacterized protein n=1 Tax=Russula earlei TaxID=71964 RepID=A0ACC0TUL8_9AGAM|nr:hypothetical protein F5148DRAFT_717919 [Russula earlei]